MVLMGHKKFSSYNRKEHFLCYFICNFNEYDNKHWLYTNNFLTLRTTPAILIVYQFCPIQWLCEFFGKYCFFFYYYFTAISKLIFLVIFLLKIYHKYHCLEIQVDIRIKKYIISHWSDNYKTCALKTHEPYNRYF